MKRILLLLAIISTHLLSFAQQKAVAEEAPVQWRYASSEAVAGLTISGLTEDEEFNCAMYVPAQAYIGDEIRSFRIGLNESVKDMKLKIWERLSEDPIYEQEIGNVEVTADTKWQEFTLTEPFKITDNKPLYIGYSITLAAGSKAIGIYDGITARSNSFYLRQGTFDWNDLSSQIAPVCVQANVYGDNIQKRSVVFGGETSVISAPGKDVTIDLMVINSGTSAANVIDIEYTVNGKTKTLESQNVNARSFDHKSFPITVKAPESLGYYNITFKVTKIDGRANDYEGEPYNVTLAVVENPTKRMVVCEELTGTGCAYCPRGIEGLKMMYEKYPDTFLGIGIHLFNGGDQMKVEDGSYNEILTKLDSAPKCIINRNDSKIGDPYMDIEEMYLSQASKTPNMKVDMYVKPLEDNSKMEVTTDLTFTNTIEASNYRLAFVVLEDGVDKDKDGKAIAQYNAFAGNPGAMHGWGDRGQWVEWVFDDVARGIYNYHGLYNSVPSFIQANQTYRYTYTINMPYVLNVENIRIAVLVINADTKLIENAGVIKFADFGQTPPVIGIADTEKNDTDIIVKNTENGFELVSSDNEESTVYLYTVSGMLKYQTSEKSANIAVPATEKGVYIIRVIKGNHTTDLKVVK